MHNMPYITTLESPEKYSYMITKVATVQWIFFHNLFCTDAAALFPKMNAEVRLSAPVLREILEDPANTI